MRTRLMGAVLGAVFAAAAWQVPAAHAAGETLTPDITAVHVGETLLLTANFCATGATVDALEVTVADGGPSGPATTTALDPGIVTQTADGFTFLYATAVDRSAVWFAATCSDAATASSSATPVLVYPPVGVLWWLDSGVGFGTEQGGNATVTATSLDCISGSTATAELVVTGTTITTASAAVSGVNLQFDVHVPAWVTPGAHEVLVTCEASAGGQIADRTAFTVFPGADTGNGGGTGTGGGTTGAIPVTGPSLQLGLGTVLLLAGLALVWFSRQSAPTD
jgi:hypothetical protein